MKSIIPRDEVFFDEFDAICSLLVEGAGELRSLLQEDARIEAQAQRVKTLESEADEVVHRTMEHLHRTFVTPFDRQDIHRLVTRLDDILDMTEAAASRMMHYRPRRILQSARDLTDVLISSVRRVQEMVGLLRDLKKRAKQARGLTVEINRLENEADRIRRSAIGRLFSEETDTLELIKWKDILEHIEEATDRCEDVADIVSGLVLEYT